jgi:hypothetical protein
MAIFFTPKSTPTILSKFDIVGSTSI